MREKRGNDCSDPQGGGRKEGTILRFGEKKGEKGRRRMKRGVGKIFLV